MLLSAVSLVLALSNSWFEEDQLNTREQAMWNRVEPSLVTLVTGNQARGVAACIDNTGLFIAHQASVTGRLMDGRTSKGKVLRFRLIAQDGPSHMMLLQASPWVEGEIKPIPEPTTEPAAGSALLAVLADGPIKAELVSSNRFGVVQPYRRALPLSEIRFERPLPLVGGALIFSENGQLVGALSATLNRANSNFDQNISTAFASMKPVIVYQKGGGAGAGGVGGGGFAPLAAGATRNNNLASGPGSLTTAYAPGTSVLKKVFEGFKSPSHQVYHASIGVFCQDALGGGSQVVTITKGSTADRAGIKEGDVIEHIGSTLIRTNLDFAKLIFDQKIGEKITVRVHRGTEILNIDVVVDRQIMQ